VIKEAPPQATVIAHKSGYLITDDVQYMQYIIMPLTPATKALVGIVALYTFIHVLVN
jgi:hypothetical protein